MNDMIVDSVAELAVDAAAEPEADVVLDDVQELQRRELLREYKKIFGGDGAMNRSAFADDLVVRIDTKIDACDVPEIHHEARESLCRNLKELRQGQFSSVAILAGQAGMGKSHLINWFRDAKRQEELGYVFVGNSNFWKVEEFESYMLTWLVTALARPDVNGPNLLLDKISQIAIQALEQILDQPGKINEYLGKHSLGLLGRLWNRFGPDKHARLKEACRRRDLEVFRELDYHKFADFVCTRFLTESQNPFHRFVLFVLLRYLFPEDRPKVCAWLVGQTVRDEFVKSLGGPYEHRTEMPADPSWPSREEAEKHFLAEFGIGDLLDLNYKLIDTIKILVSLFSPQTPRNGSPPSPSGRVFLFAFDQVEGRNELFESETDWVKFFAKLSELYNTLPNLCLVFTMTTDLRNRLYPKMEAQFRQRISRDRKFVLEAVADAEILAVYKRRIELWTRGKLTSDLEKLLARPEFEYLPFTQEEILGLSRQKVLREALVTFDEKTRQYLNEQVIVGEDPRLEFLVALNELREVEKTERPFDYMRPHLESAATFLRRSAARIGQAYGVSLDVVEAVNTEMGQPALRLEFSTSLSGGKWLKVFLAKLDYSYTSSLPGFAKLLLNKMRNRHFLWLVRPTARPISLTVDLQNRSEQVFARHNIEPSVETRLRAIAQLLDKEDAIQGSLSATQEEKERFHNEVDKIVLEEIKLTYLGEVLQHASEALERLAEGGDHEAE